MKKKIAAAFLAIIMVFGIVATAYADGHRPPVMPVCEAANALSGFEMVEMHTVR